MKRKLQRLLILATIIAACVILNPTEVWAASESDLTFELNDDGKSYYVADCNESASGELTIPATYNGKPVTGIGEWAFNWCTELTSVTISDSITSIDMYAFSHCTNLTSVTIPDSVTRIRLLAFEHCSSLTGIWVDKKNPNYSSDKNGVLFNKDKTTLVAAPGAIENYVIPDTVTTVGFQAFFACKSLTSVTIPNSVTTIDHYAFVGCENLSTVNLSDSVISIGYWAFAGCSSLKTIYYAGDETQFDKIDIDEYENDDFLNAEIVYNTEPIKDKEDKKNIDDDDDEDDDNGSNMTVIIVAIAAAVVVASAATVVTVVILKKKKQ